MNVYFLGFGAVARSLMRLILRGRVVPTDCLRAVDRAPEAGEAFVRLGGPADGFRSLEIRRDNLDDVFAPVRPGDIVFALGDMLGTRVLCERCLREGVRYLSASADDFPGGALATPSFTADEYRAYRRLFDATPKDAPSCVVSTGMNPGAVSLFAKRAIRELAGGSVSDYAATAREIGVESVDVTDLDDTAVSFAREPGVVYSTWSPTEFFTESTLNIEFTRGCGVPVRETFGEAEFEDPTCGFVACRALAYERTVGARALAADGRLVPFRGHVVAHDEIVSIPAYLSVRENGRTVYRPESRFVYSAAPVARESLADVVRSGRPPRGYHLIGPDEIVSGGESVGVVVSGARCGSVYVGTRYDISTVPAGETPTVLQVAAGCLAALRHVLDNPRAGARYPDEIDEDAFLAASGLPITIVRNVEFAKPTA